MTVMKLNGAAMRRAGQMLWSAWREGRHLPGLPEECRPTTVAEGYRIQTFVAQFARSKPVGWKLAATSAAGQAHVGVDAPLAGRLLADRVRQDGATVPLAGCIMRVAEPEFAFRIGTSMARGKEPFDQVDVMAAVASLHPAIELPDSRYADYAHVGAAQLAADNACAHYCVIGPPAPDGWRSIDLAAHRTSATLNGKPAGEGSGANVLGDPRIALTWLANDLRKRELRLMAGDIVITGTSLKPIPVAPGDVVVGDFGVLGKVSMRLADTVG
jgi:2-keto-4-pentenoate hydratase